MADEVVGSVYVIIRAIADKIRDDIRKGVERSADDADDDLKKTGEEIGEKLGTHAGDTASKRIAKKIVENVRKDDDQYGRAGTIIGDAIGRDILAPGALRRIGQRITRSFSNLLNPIEDSALNGGGEIGKKIGQGIASGFPVKGFLVPLLAPALTAALQVIGSYVAGATALLSNLGPVFAGGILSGVSAMLALKQATLGVGLAFKTATPELAAFQKKFTAFKDEIGKAVQGTLLPRLTTALDSLRKSILPDLKARLAETGTVLGKVAIKFADMAKRKLFRDDLNEVMRNNNHLLGTLGTALVRIIGLFVHILAAAKPVIKVFEQFAKRLGLAAERFTNASDSGERLNAFFTRAAERMKQWGRILGNFSKAFFNIFKIARPFGDAMADSIERISEKFLGFTKSAEGTEKIKNFFKSMMPIMHEFNLLIGDIFKALGRGLVDPKSNKSTVEFIRAIRTQLVPALGTMFTTLNKLAPALISMTEGFSKLITALSESGGIQAFITTLNAAYKVLSLILSIPLVGKLAGMTIAFLALSKAMNLLTFGQFGKRVLGPIGAQIGQQIAKMGLFTKAINLLKFALKGLGRAFLFVGQMLARVFLMNPYILAIVALIAVIVLLWKKSETFRKIVTAAWNAVKAVVGAVVDWFTNTAVPWMVGAFHKISDAVGAVVDFIRDHWKLIISIIAGPIGIIVALVVSNWRRIKDFISGAMNAIWAVITAVWNAIKTVITTVVSAIATAISFYVNLWKTVITTALNVIKTIVTTVWNAIKAVTSAVWNAIKSVISSVVNAIKRVVTSVFNTVKSVVTGVWNAIKSATSTAWNAIKKVVSSAVNTVVSTVKNMKSKITGFFSNAGSWLKNAGKNLINGFINGIKDKFGDVKGTLGSLTKSLTSWKGPESLDKKILRKSGQLVINGFISGLESRYAATQSSLADLTKSLTLSANAINAGMNGLRPSAASGRGIGPGGVPVNGMPPQSNRNTEIKIVNNYPKPETASRGITRAARALAFFGVGEED